MNRKTFTTEKQGMRGAARIAIGFAASLAMMMLFAGGAQAKAEYTFKIGSLVTPSSVWGKTVAATIREIKRRTDGRVEITHIHSGALGSEKGMLEMTLIGGIQGAGLPSSSLAAIVPEAHILELPFLFRDRDEAYHLIDKVIAPVLKKKLEAKGLSTDTFLENGFMELVMRYPVKKPDDMAKCKIGSWESPVHIAFWKTAGGNPIPIPATEVFTAYTRGMVDSGANSVNAMIAWDGLFGSSLRRSDIYITPLHFSYQAGVLVLNKKAVDALPKDLHEILDDELGKLTWRIRNNLRDADATSEAALKKKGYNFVDITPAEKKVFEKRAQKVYREFEPMIGKAFLKKVLTERAAYRKRHPETKETAKSGTVWDKRAKE